MSNRPENAIKPMQQTVYKRQLGFLFFVILPAAKLLLLPSLLAFHAERNAALSMLVGGLADLLVLFLVCLAIRIAPEANLGDLLQTVFGKVGARIFLGLYCLYFLLKAYPVIFEQKSMLNQTLYHQLPFLPTFIPYFIVLIYTACKGARVLGRNADLYWFFVACAFGLLLVLSIESADFSNLLPVLYDGPGPVLKGIWANLTWFGDFAALLAFLGKIRFAPQDKKKIWPILTGGAAAVGTAVLFMVLTVAVFGPTVVKQAFALTRISKYSAFLSNSGRFDWLAIILLMIGIFLNSSVMLYAAAESLRQIYGGKSSLLPTLICGAALFALLVVIGDNFTNAYEIYSRFLTPAAAVLQIALPACTPLLALRYRRKHHA